MQDSNVQSILRNGKPKKARISSIKFLDDSQLIKVYGDDLPNQGLQVSPTQLKKNSETIQGGGTEGNYIVRGYVNQIKTS